MLTGLFAGVFWGLGTVILGVAMEKEVFAALAAAALLGPFVSTFLHQAGSAGWMAGYMALRRQLGKGLRTFRSRSAIFIALGAIFGGPIGLSCYTISIRLIGPTYSAVITSMYPAVGALFARIFLGEKLRPVQWLGLFASIGGVIALGYTPGQPMGSNLALGFLSAVACCVAWALEAVVCAVGLNDPSVSDEDALFVRNICSAVFYAVVGVTAVRGWGFTAQVLVSDAMMPIMISALAGVLSYLCYYKAIVGLGAAKAMALNITYSAWAMLFSAVLMRTMPDLKSILCAVVIVIGSLVAANKNKQAAE